MAYTATTWNDGDLITAEKLNKLEQGVENEQIGPQGPAGATGAKGDKGDPGAYVTKIELTKGADGAITGGTATLSDETTAPITVIDSV